MSKNNNFHCWLKLQDDFFDREEVKFIESQKNGKDYIIFYLKLLLKSIKNDGKLYFRDSIPYTPEMLAKLTDINIDTVRVAVDIFIKFGMMQRWDNGTLYMIEAQNMMERESKWARIKRNQRAKNKEIGHCPTNVQLLSNDKKIGHCPTNVHLVSNKCPLGVQLSLKEKPLKDGVEIDILSQQNNSTKIRNKVEITKKEVNKWLSEGGLR